MQRQMEEKTERIGRKRMGQQPQAVELLRSRVSGKKRSAFRKIKSEEVVDPDDIEMLEDLIVAATNEALRKMEEENAAMMNQLTGGLGGMF